jgi:hypothetical protein
MILIFNATKVTWPVVFAVKVNAYEPPILELRTLRD